MKPPLRYAGGRILAVAALAAVIAACSSNKNSTSTPTPSSAATGSPTATAAAKAPAAAATYSVQVDGKPGSFNGAFLAFFPKETVAHPGDTVQFKVIDTGEPHSATLGTLVDAGAAAVAKAPTAPPGTLPEMAKIPELIPATGGDAIQVGAQPCFIETGAPPKDVCTKDQQKQTDFNGKQAYYNSGWLAADKPFTVKLAADIKPGTYAVMCLVHREAMIAKVTVVDATASAPSPADAAAKGKAEFDAKVKALQPAADAVAKLTADKAQAGNLSPDVLDGMVNAFGPKDISIPVGGKVTWTVLGPHTISFNAPEDAKTLRVNAPDGSVHLNPKTAAPSKGPGQPQPPAGAAPPPPDPKAPPVLIQGGTWDGTGFMSSGIIVSFPPGPLFQYQLSFSKAGTYQFKCLIHDNMEGTVKVG